MGRTAATAGGFTLFVLLVTGLLRFGKGTLVFHQRFAIRDRDLIVIRVDFREGEEAVAISAIVNESRLERRFNPRNFGEVDVAS